ncbi:helix-turn-helix domain-containing protein [Streptomyces sp. NPDC054786]
MVPAGVTAEDRRDIEAGLAEDLPYAAIARRLGRPTSTVSREVARNGGPGGYRAEHADRAKRLAATPPAASARDATGCRRRGHARTRPRRRPRLRGQIRDHDDRDRIAPHGRQRAGLPRNCPLWGADCCGTRPTAAGHPC